MAPYLAQYWAIVKLIISYPQLWFPVDYKKHAPNCIPKKEQGPLTICNSSNLLLQVLPLFGSPQRSVLPNRIHNRSDQW